MQLHSESLGRGHPLVILHGLLGSLRNWHILSRELARDFRVLAVDQRNHGKSPHTPEMNYRLMAEDLIDLLEGASLPRAHILGHSMGGKTAMQFALLHPERVSKLVIVDIAPRKYEALHDEVFAGLLSLKLDAYRTRREMEDALATHVPDLAVRRFLLKNVETLRHTGFRWKIGLQEIHQNYDRLREAVEGPWPFTGPSLFIRGSDSRYLSEEDLAFIRERFPRAQLRTIPGASHWVHTEQPEAFVQVTRDFLFPELSIVPPGIRS
jgi:esterase